MEDRQLPELVIQHVLTISEEEFAAVSVENLSRFFKVDRFKLSREFKHQTEMKLEEFLFREKMMRAALMLLVYRDITVKEVAERIGFCTCDYFIRVFRQFYGVVPGRFREYKTPRSGGDRRSELKDRRQKVQKSNIPGAGNRRVGPKARRDGRKDRRKQNGNNNHDNHENPERECDMEQNQDTVQAKVQEPGNGNSCKNCHFRKFALNFDDGK